MQLQYFSIAAPYTGKIGRIPVKVGDFVNTSTELATLTQNNPLEVNISIPIELSSRVRVGTPIELLNVGRETGRQQSSFLYRSQHSNKYAISAGQISVRQC